MSSLHTDLPRFAAHKVNMMVKVCDLTKIKSFQIKLPNKLDKIYTVDLTARSFNFN